LAAWRARVSAQWSRLSIRIEETGKEKEVAVGAAVAVTVRARLDPLTPEDVSVEVCHGPLDTTGEIRDGGVVRARHEGREGEEDIFRAEIPCDVTGRYGYTARILPRHPDLANPLTPLLLTLE
ncbi:MAG: alpha-glucan phosphorylase, partial [Deltaproteobacteria bacterium]|nr:alpha-glucan phosphorylase [Deltaproteobacteria bacterium]